MGLYENNNNTLSLLAGGNSTFYADAPIGSIYPYGGTTAPEGFLICDGSAVSRETYADLFAVIGTSFGSGDGSTTFNIPDLRGEFLRGAGTNSHSGQGNGGTVGQHQDGTEHTHAYAFDDNTLGIFIKQKGSGFNAKANNIDSVAAEEVEYMTTSNITKQDQEIHPALYTSRPTNTSVNYIIKATIIALPVDILGTVDDKIDDAIAALDVSSVGGSGKYISAISETDGKISATETTLSTTPTSGSNVPITSGSVYAEFAKLKTWTDVTSQAVKFTNESHMSSNFIHVYTNGYECLIEGEYQLSSNYETITGGWISNLSHISIKSPYLPKKQSMLGGFIVNDNHGPIIWYLSVGGGFQGYTGSTATTLQRVPITGRWCI